MSFYKHLPSETLRESWLGTFIDEIWPRIEFLLKHNRDLEVFFLLSVTIETALHNLILSSERFNKIRGLEPKKFPLENLCLGQLIGIFRDHYSSDNKLIQRLNKFLKIRNRIAHKIFDYETVDEVDRIANKYFLRSEKLLIELAKLGLQKDKKFTKELKKLLKLAERQKARNANNKPRNKKIDSPK